MRKKCVADGRTVTPRVVNAEAIRVASERRTAVVRATCAAADSVSAARPAACAAVDAAHGTRTRSSDSATSGAAIPNATRTPAKRVILRHRAEVQHGVVPAEGRRPERRERKRIVGLIEYEEAIVRACDVGHHAQVVDAEHVTRRAGGRGEEGQSWPRARDFGGEALDRAGIIEQTDRPGRRAAQRNGARVLTKGGRADERVIAALQVREAHCVDELCRAGGEYDLRRRSPPTFRRGVSHPMAPRIRVLVDPALGDSARDDLGRPERVETNAEIVTSRPRAIGVRERQSSAMFGERRCVDLAARRDHDRSAARAASAAEASTIRHARPMSEARAGRPRLLSE